MAKEIFISTNGIHLNIIIPKEHLKGRIQQELQLQEYTNYVSFGWGDKIFYLETPTWGDLKFTTALRAIFLKSEAAMHITNYQRRNDNWLKVSICEEQLELLLAYLNNSFTRNNQGSIIEIKDSGYTLFYMGINIGAFLGILVCGYLGEKVGWHYGFGAACVGMSFGLVLFYSLQNLLGDVGL